MKPMRLYMILLFPFLRIFYFLAGLFPRRGDLWVFGSYQNLFVDNSKYLFSYVVEHAPHIQAVWITSNQKIIDQIERAGGTAVKRWSLSGLWYACRAKYWFISAYASDINYYASRGACVINLWHGVPMKKIEFDIDSGPLKALYNSPTFLERNLFAAAVHRRPDYILSTSEYATNTIFSSAFRVPADRCLRFGNPRLDPFSWSHDRRTAWLARWEKPVSAEFIRSLEKFQRVFVYMPTWRDANPDFLLNMDLDFESLNRELRSTNTAMVFKLHVNTPPESLKVLENYSNILVMNPRDDIYPLLPMTDGLITDYSSIVYDYLLVDRPIRFFAFDLDDYLSKSRGSYQAYEDVVIGAPLRSGAELIAALRTEERAEDTAQRRAMREKVLGDCRGNASERVVEFFTGLDTRSARLRCENWNVTRNPGSMAGK